MWGKNSYVLHSSCARCGCCGLAEKPETSERGPSGKNLSGRSLMDCWGRFGGGGGWLGWWERSLDCCVLCNLRVGRWCDRIRKKEKHGSLSCYYFIFHFDLDIWRERDHYDYTPKDNTSRVTVLQLTTQTDLNLLLCLVIVKWWKKGRKLFNFVFFLQLFKVLGGFVFLLLLLLLLLL
jgi:hypothetical protein